MKDICFRMCTFLVLLFASMGLHAQQILVKGTVVEKATGLSVIGVSIVEVGAESNGTITDIDGNFSLSVSSKSHLSISYIGFQTVTVQAQPTIRIELLEDSQMLNEVVVTGYTTQRKADLTGSVAVVSTDALKTVSSPDPMKALQGSKTSNYGLNLNAKKGMEISANNPKTGKYQRYIVNGMYDISLSYATEQCSSMFSLGYKKNTGILKYTDFEKSVCPYEFCILFE